MRTSVWLVGVCFIVLLLLRAGDASFFSWLAFHWALLFLLWGWRVFTKGFPKIQKATGWDNGWLSGYGVFRKRGLSGAVAGGSFLQDGR